jgi:hypothetical protein
MLEIIMRNISHFIPLALFSTLALSASVPYTFTAGAPAVAAEVNANFAALASAITALEAKVAALESGGVLTTSDVAGTYKLLSLSSKTVGGDNASLEFGASSGSAQGVLVLAANGTFTLSGTQSRSEFRAKGTQCNTPGTFATSNSGPSTSGTSGSHFHTYNYAACTSGGFVNSQPSEEETENSSGSWAIASADSFTVTPTGEAAITVYMSKAGRVGHGVMVDTETGGNTSGRKFEMFVLFKRS